MILAAGRGERMRPLTDVKPKPLLDVGGKPLIEHHIERLALAGVRDLIINLAWKGAMLRDTLGDGSRFGTRIVYSDEGDRALETGGGIANALPLLGADPFLIVNGDVWTDYPFETLVRKFANGAFRGEAPDLAHLVLVPNPPQHTQGDFSLRDGRVTLRGEHAATYSGIAVYSPDFFRGSPSGPFRLLTPLQAAINAARVSGELYAGQWFDIGTPARLGELDALLRARSA